MGWRVVRDGGGESVWGSGWVQEARGSPKAGLADRFYLPTPEIAMGWRY